MKMDKTFDCVKMKNEIQAELLQHWKGLSSAEIDVQIRDDLSKSQSPVGKLWRRLRAIKRAETIPRAVNY